MISIFEALSGAFRSLFSLRMLWLMVWPVLSAMAIWAILAFFFWTPLQNAWQWLFNYFGLGEWFTGIEPAWIGAALQVILHLMLYVPLVMLTALVLTAIFGMDAMVNIVSERFYPDLLKKHGGSILGSSANAFTAVVVYIGLWIVTLPLWLLGPIGAVIPFVTAGYLNQRLFRYDALAIHADPEELKSVVEKNKGDLWVLGILLGLIQFMPLLNFFAPVFTGLAFIHLCLGKLAQKRTSAQAPAA